MYTLKISGARTLPCGGPSLCDRHLLIFPSSSTKNPMVLQWRANHVHQAVVHCHFVGHVLRREDEYADKRVMAMEVPVKRRRGRPKRRWLDSIRNDLFYCAGNLDIERYLVQLGGLEGMIIECDNRFKGMRRV